MSLVLLALAGCGSATPSQESSELGYAIGFQVGDDFRRMERPLDPAAVAAGIRDALEGREPAIATEEQETLLGELQKQR